MMEGGGVGVFRDRPRRRVSRKASTQRMSGHLIPSTCYAKSVELQLFSKLLPITYIILLILRR